MTNFFVSGFISSHIFFTASSISAANKAGSAVRQEFLLFWRGEMSQDLERRRSHSPGEAGDAVVQQPGHACS
jgi:hypothetical protein